MDTSSDAFNLTFTVIHDPYRVASLGNTCEIIATPTTKISDIVSELRTLMGIKRGYNVISLKYNNEIMAALTDNVRRIPTVLANFGIDSDTMLQIYMRRAR